MIDVLEMVNYLSRNNILKNLLASMNIKKLLVDFISI